MRLIILVTMFFFIFVIDVNASDTYYTDYNSFQTYSENLDIDEDLINIESKRMYKYYQEEITGDYFLYGENPLEYFNFDPTDNVVTPFTEWSTDIPSDRPYRTIEFKDVYRYQEIKEVRYIHFNNFLGGNDKLNITEIIVLAGSKEIDYSVYCEQCSASFNDYINNGVIYENNSFVLTDGYIRLDLNDYYPLDSLEIKVYFYDTTTEEKRINIYMTRDKELRIGDNVYVYNLVRSFFTHHEIGEIYELVFDIDFVLFVNPEYTEFKYSDVPLENTKTRFVIKDKMYRYKDMKFYYYSVNRVYLDGYYENNPGYIRDYEQYLDYYRYQTRDRIVIEKEIVIKDDFLKIENFIVATSDYKIIGEIDYKQNGKYKVEILFGDLILEKEVIVANINNVLNELEISIESLKEKIITNIKNDNHNLSNYDYLKIEDKYNDLVLHIETKELINNDNNRYELVYEKLDPEKKKMLIDLINKIDGLQSNLETKIEEFTKISENKVKSIINNWLIFITLVIFLIILIIVIVNKKVPN